MVDRHECEVCARPGATRRLLCDECRQIAGQPLGEAAKLLAVAGVICVVLIVGATVWQYTVAPLSATLPMLGWVVAGVLYVLGGVITGFLAVAYGEPFDSVLPVGCAFWPVSIMLVGVEAIWRWLCK